MKLAGSILAVAALAAPAAGARVVFEETFTDAVRNTGSGADVYTIVGNYNWYTYSPADSAVEPGSGASAGTIVFTDTGGGAGRLEQNMGTFGNFDTSLPADSIITFSIDMKVESYSSGNGLSHPRFVMKDGGRTNPYFSVGFSRGTGSDSGRLFLFAGDTEGTNNYFGPTLANAIGYDSTTGTWADGFDFGTYSLTTDDNDTNDEFYRLAVTFNPFDGSTQIIDVTATQLSTGKTASLAITVTTPYHFSRTALNGIAVNAGGSAQGVMQVDNIKVTVVPEPAALSLLGLGALGLGRRRRVYS